MALQVSQGTSKDQVLKKLLFKASSEKDVIKVSSNLFVKSQ